MDCSFIKSYFVFVDKLLGKFPGEFANAFLKEFLIKVC